MWTGHLNWMYNAEEIENPQESKFWKTFPVKDLFYCPIHCAHSSKQKCKLFHQVAVLNKGEMACAE